MQPNKPLTHACSAPAGSSVGLALGTLGLPFVQAAVGAAGLRTALVWDMVNTVAGARVLPAPPAVRPLLARRL